MSKIRAHEFVSLDGVYEDPRWTADFGFTEAMGAAIGAMTTASSGILLGRTTFEMFAPAWSQRSAEEDPGAPFFNDTPKYVVSATKTAVDEWQNSTLFGPYDPEAIRELKNRVDGLFVSGSGTLVRGLLADGLLDELHLMVYPTVLGFGARLFPDGAPPARLTLAGYEAFDNGVLHLTYAPAA